jgi:hypothetical protein
MSNALRSIAPIYGLSYSRLDIVTTLKREQMILYQQAFV